MLEVEERIDPLRAELPDFSVDWRFLLPVQPGARLLVLTEAGIDFSAQFEGLGLQVVSCSVLAAEAVLLPDAGEAVLPELGLRVIAPREGDPFVPNSFSAIAIPFGIPDAMVGSDLRVGRLARLKALLQPGGTILLGFSGPWGILRRGPRLGITAMPDFFVRELEEAGYAPIRLYGVAPNLTRPAYIFPLTKQTVHFFLRHRFLGRRGSALLRLLPLTPTLVSRLLPGYFLLAGA